MARLLSVHRLLDEAAGLPLVGSRPLPNFSAKLTRCDEILEKIKPIRHKLLAHRDSKLSWQDVFSSAALPLSEIRELLRITHEILRSLRVWFDRTYIGDQQDAASDTKALIETLREARHERKARIGS